jgi:hypothetical protein
MLNNRLIKTLLILCVLLLALALLMFYHQVPHPKTPYAKAVDKADVILVQRGPDKVELDLQTKEWRVKNPQGGSFAIDSDKIKTLLSSLRNLQVDDEISDRADRATDYDVTEASATGVTLLSKSTTLAEGFFGKQAPDYTHIYFRFPNKPTVYLARGVILGDLGGSHINDWRNRSLLEIPDAQIQSIRIEGKGYNSDLMRSSDTWTLNGQKIDPGPVYAMVGALAHLHVADFVDPATPPLITYESLKTAVVHVASDHTQVDLHFGAQDKQTHRYPVALSKDAGIAWIEEAQAMTILRKPSDFKSL